MRRILAGLFRLVFRRRVQALDGIPGPPPLFPFGNALDFLGRRWPWEVCADYGRQYGGLTLIWLGGRPGLVLNDPALIGDVLSRDTEDVYKAGIPAALRPIVTAVDPFVANGKDWEVKRAR